MIIEQCFKPVMVALAITGFLTVSLPAIADEIAPPAQESVPVRESVPGSGSGSGLVTEGPASNVKSEAPSMQMTAAENGAGNLATYAQYTNQIKTRVEEALAAQKELAESQYRFVVHIWIARDGKVERAELQGSSGDHVTDDLIRQALAGMKPIAEAPPEDMPQPVKLRITSKNAGDESAKKMIHVEYVPDFIKNQLREEVKLEVMAQAKAEGWATPGVLPAWLDRIALEGDMRLRYERDMFPAGNATPQDLELQGTSINNTSVDRNRLLVRARLGIRYKVSDVFSGGLRLTTGNANNPDSPNQTLGGDYQTSSKFAFGLDRAYIKYAPHPWLSFSGGRIENPWLNTDLVWDPDFAFDGVVTSMRPKVGENLTAFATLGAFPIQNVDTNGSTVQANSRWLYGTQAGLEWMSANQSALKFGLAYYDFTNIQGVLNDPNSTAQNQTGQQFHQKGNTAFDITNPAVNPLTDIYGMASKFREVDLTGMADFAAFNPVHVVLTGDYVSNVGFNASEVQAMNPVSPIGGNKGWMVKLLVGMPETTHWNDWNLFAAYKRLETNAVLDAYTDSDFHLGGTNAKGWIAGGSYGIDKNTWLSLRWFSADEIVGPPLAIDVLMLDLNAKF